MFRRFAFPLLLLAATLLGWPPGSRASAAVQAAAPDPRFGITEAFWAPEEAAELGAGWERILFYWREIQPEGPDDWNTLHVREEWLAQANAQGRAVVGLIKNTAPWASVDGTEAGVPKGLYLPIDDPENLWANFVRRAASYYGARNVHHWIIWNEPEIRPGVYGYEFAGSPADYLRLLKVAYQVMKAEDPAAVIHLAGLTWWHDQTYLDRLLALAAADPEAGATDGFFDVVSLHVYFRSESVLTIVAAVEAALARHGFDKPIWINESNAPPNEDPEWPVARPQFPVDLDQQAWFIVQAHALAFASGIERVAVYKLLDIHLPTGGESFGLLRPDYSRRPAFQAYQTTTALLGGFGDVRRQQAPSFQLVTFERPAGLTQVLWARTAAAVQVRLAARSDVAYLIDSSGREEIVHADAGEYVIALEGARCRPECLIGGPPLFLVEPGASLAQPPGPAAVVDSTASPSARTTLTPSPSPSPRPTLTPTATPSPTPTVTPSPAAPAATPTAAAAPTLPAATAVPATGAPGVWFLVAAGFVAAGVAAWRRRHG